MTSPNLLSPELEAMIDEALPHLFCTVCEEAAPCSDADGCCFECGATLCEARLHLGPLVRTLVRCVVERCAMECRPVLRSMASRSDLAAAIRALAQPKEK